MATITRFIEEDPEVTRDTAPTYVIADYTITRERDLLQLRTYKSGDMDRTEGPKQNIQLTRNAATQLRTIIDRFLEQNS